MEQISSETSIYQKRAWNEAKCTANQQPARRLASSFQPIWPGGYLPQVASRQVPQEGKSKFNWISTDKNNLNIAELGVAVDRHLFFHDLILHQFNSPKIHDLQIRLHQSWQV